MLAVKHASIVGKLVLACNAHWLNEGKILRHYKRFSGVATALPSAATLVREQARSVAKLQPPHAKALNGNMKITLLSDI